MCSILCWILSIWEALGCNFFILAWFMHCQQGGEVWACFGLLNVSRRFSGGFEPFWAMLWPVWPVESPFWPVSAGSVRMLGTGLTGGIGRSDRSELSWCSCSVSWSSPHAFVQGELHWFRGSLHVCRGALFGFRVWIGGLRYLLEHSFVSNVSSRCPCLRGPRLVFFK
jgi:hypothetical protein